MNSEVRKVLSANDLGETGSKQAGILVPKEKRVLDFFPLLDVTERNPRVTIVVREKPSNTRWEFNFIYYNKKLFGEGTRNEYRLTVMTKFLREANAKVGDILIFTTDSDASYEIELQRVSRSTPLLNEDGALVLSSGWTVIARR